MVVLKPHHMATTVEVDAVWPTAPRLQNLTSAGYCTGGQQLLCETSQCRSCGTPLLPALSRHPVPRYNTGHGGASGIHAAGRLVV